MGAVDPTYPLLPTVNIISCVLLLLVLISSAVRRNWNFGVTSLCFWLFLENLGYAINHIVWSDNFEVRLYVYCDIFTHLELICAVVKPMATLIISRRLHAISCLRSIDQSDNKRWNMAIDWTSGLLVPLVVAGPFYYIVQGYRFHVVEGFGCTNSQIWSILTILLMQLWNIIPPLISVTLYYPKVLRTFYLQRKDVNSVFRGSTQTVLHKSHLRILALASIDVLLTLPIGIVNLVLFITQGLQDASIPFYPGWSYVHTGWTPVGFPYTELEADTSGLVATYFTYWSTPALAFAIFGLFGFTFEARDSYWRVVCMVLGRFGWKASSRQTTAPSDLRSMQFGAFPPLDVELGTHPEFVDLDAHSMIQVSHNINESREDEDK
ncbi:unnamed protein product [Peniophora sp. CBMAI 1063]|nr:unnamed protein product [Peniophora sp. CBMAI 1063]